MTLYHLVIAHEEGVEFLPIFAESIDDEMELLARGWVPAHFVGGPIDYDFTLTWRQAKERWGANETIPA